MAGINLKASKKRPSPKKQTLKEALKAAREKGLKEIVFKGKRYKVSSPAKKGSKLSTKSKRRVKLG